MKSWYEKVYGEPAPTKRITKVEPVKKVVKIETKKKLSKKKKSVFRSKDALDYLQNLKRFY